LLERVKKHNVGSRHTLGRRSTRVAPIEQSFRLARKSDASDLAVLMDTAARGLVAWLWSTLRAPGQSILEVGRHRILVNMNHPMHFTNWTVAEIGGEVAGGLTGFLVPEPDKSRDVSDLPEVFGHIWN
jgi:hypothetical protein